MIQFYFIFSIILSFIVIVFLVLQKQNKKSINETEKYYELKFQIRLLSFSLVLASVLLGFLSWNVKKDAINELKTEIFQEFDSVLNFYVAEHSVTTSTEDTLRINFSDLKRTNNENLPKFYKSPLMFVSAENAVFSVIRITKNYVTIRLIPEGKFIIGEIKDYDYNGKITLWFVESGK